MVLLRIDGWCPTARMCKACTRFPPISIRFNEISLKLESELIPRLLGTRGVEMPVNKSRQEFVTRLFRTHSNTNSQKRVWWGWAAITRSQNTAVVQAEIMGGARTRALPKACALPKLRWPYHCGKWSLPMPRGRTGRLGAAHRIGRGN